MLFLLLGRLVQISVKTRHHQPEHGVLGFLVIGQHALYDVLCVKHCGSKYVKPQDILIYLNKSRENILESVNHFDKVAEIIHVAFLVELAEERAVSKSVVEYRFVRVSYPEAKVRRPQLVYRFLRVRDYRQRV